MSRLLTEGQPLPLLRTSSDLVALDLRRFELGYGLDVPIVMDAMTGIGGMDRLQTSSRAWLHRESRDSISPGPALAMLVLIPQTDYAHDHDP